MKLLVVGIEQQNYTMDNGYSFKGRKLHCVDQSTEKEVLQGNVVTTIKIADDTPLASVDIKVGGIYCAYFTQKGTLDYLREDNQK